MPFALDDYADGFCSSNGGFWGRRFGFGIGGCRVDWGWKWDVPLTTEVDAVVRFATDAVELHVFVEEGLGGYVSAIGGSISFIVNDKREGLGGQTRIRSPGRLCLQGRGL